MEKGKPVDKVCHDKEVLGGFLLGIRYYLVAITSPPQSHWTVAGFSFSFCCSVYILGVIAKRVRVVKEVRYTLVS
jgi:hypothetical protein